jgi:precorrin-3B synthase
LPDPGRATPTALAARPVEDRCPGIVRLHPAGDGLLARVRLPGGRLSATALGAIGDVAALGSGIVELTSRANVQVRGLDEDAAAAATGTANRGASLPASVARTAFWSEAKTAPSSRNLTSRLAG